jgi:AcrR family transcriptional regulator
VARAAVKLFTAQGFDNTYVEEITQHAGVAKGTFYTFFAKKEDVLVDYLKDKIAKCHNRHKINPSAPFIKQYEALITNYLKYIFINKHFAGILLKERIMSQGIISNPYEAKAKKTIAQLVEVAKQRGEIKNEVETGTVVEVITGLNTLYIIYWVNGTLKKREECVTKICNALKLFVQGIHA